MTPFSKQALPEQTPPTQLLSERELQTIRNLSPMWQSLQPLQWRNPLGYRLSLIEQPKPAQDAAPQCALQGCRYTVYRPGETEAYGHCASHREATAMVLEDVLARLEQARQAGATHPSELGLAQSLA
ncbi:MAG: hypothetical protein HC824_17760 [Synechococcales cyanobacterium RM1_1_8]|nr:hypothetical protein [Synechococcales cyanobacterium RM1_1_8]